MPCSYCGESLNSNTSCRVNPFSDFHVGTESPQEAFEKSQAWRRQQERSRKCSYCDQPKDAPTSCPSNPFSDFHV